MKKIGRSILVLILILAMSFGAAGCGGGEETGGVSSLTIGSATGIDTLNPLSSYKLVTFELFLLMYDPLVRYADDYSAKPCLATEWTVSEDDLTWTFKLQEGVSWHDGEPFTSADVKYTYELMMNSGLGYMYSAYLTGITDIECPDDNTVVITTDAPKANMLMNTTPIIPEHIWSGVAEEELESYANDQPVGTGPYKFDSTGEGFVKLIRNGDYFAAVPAVEEYIFVEYANTDALAQALMLGEIDAATNLNASQLSQLRDDGNVSVIAGEMPGFVQIGINVWEDPASKGDPILRDRNVRHAIELAVDKIKIIDMCYGGLGAEGTTLINSGDAFHYEPTAEEIRNFDPEKAKSVLEQAGYKDTDGDGIREDANGSKLEFELATLSDNVEELKAGQLITANCMDIGISLINTVIDDGALMDKIYAADYDLFIWGWGADIDPTTILEVLTTDQIGGNNEPYFSNARYDELFLEQQNEMDIEKRKALVAEMQGIVYEEAPYIILLYDNNLQAIRQDRWEGFKQIPEAGTYFFNLTDYNYMNIKPVE